MKLPFLVDDGQVVRPCELRDLEIIYHFELDFIIYSKERHWWLLRKKEDIDLLYVLRTALNTVKRMSIVLPPGSVTSLRMLDYFNVHKVKCKKLHKFRDKILLDLVLFT
jgi:hypothetical protein